MTQPEPPATPVSGRVADWMLTDPVVCGSGTTIGALRALFDDDHLHAALITAGGRLVSVVGRADLHPGLADADNAADLGGLAGRTVAPGESAETVRQRMIRASQQRLAVVDDTGRLLGLLCLKRRRHGFCTERDVAARAGDRGVGRRAVSP